MACEGKLGNCNFFQEEEDEEALSLSDLPINLIKEEKSNKSEVDEGSRLLIKSEEDFDFHSWSRESEMCAADDVFFKGQILPMRHSISSESGLTISNLENLNPSHCVTRSESMDHYGSLRVFTSFSSRSNSHYSTSSTSSTSTARNPKPRIRNQFHTYPSPKPQIRVSIAPTITNRSQKSPIWGFFRVGLVRMPGIELQDLKVRSSVSRNSSSGSSNNSSTGHNGQSTNMEKQRKHMFIDRERLLSGCSCSVGSAVKPVPREIIIIKSNSDIIKGSQRESKESMEKQGKQELKMKKKKKTKKKKKKLTMEKQQGKQNGSRHCRTFEWIKELSHGSGHPDS